MTSREPANQEAGTNADTVRKRATAPDPDHGAKPDAPTDLKSRSWKYVFKRSINEFTREKCTDQAAGLTYFAMLSLFPALLAVVSLLGVIGQAETTTQNMLRLIENFASEQVVETLRDPITKLASTSAAGFALVVGVLGAVWSASKYVGAFGRSMNRIYDVEEGRPFYKLKPVILLITLVLLLATAVMAAMLILSGPIAESLGRAISLGENGLMIWNIAKWPIALAFAVLLVAVLYYGTPNVQQPKFRWISMGSVIALVVLAVATFGFFFYVSRFGNYNATYGAIGGVIVLLLWLWIVNLSLLFGAVFDSELERARELEAGIEAEESLQLPPRDVKASKKQQKKEEKDIRQGEELRHASELAAEEQAGDNETARHTSHRKED